MVESRFFHCYPDVIVFDIIISLIRPKTRFSNDWFLDIVSRVMASTTQRYKSDPPIYTTWLVSDSGCGNSNIQYHLHPPFSFVQMNYKYALHLDNFLCVWFNLHHENNNSISKIHFVTHSGKISPFLCSILRQSITIH